MFTLVLQINSEAHPELTKQGVLFSHRLKI